MSQPVSIIIPTYNAGPSLPLLAARIEAAMQHHPHPFEIIMVDDGSPNPESWRVIKSLAAQYPWLRGVKLARNVGQYTATLVGLRLARHPLCVTMDDDLQHPPEAIPELLAALSPDTDLVYAAPRMPVQSVPYRNLVLLVKCMLCVICCAPHLSHMRSFRAMRTGLYPWQHARIARHATPDGLLKTVYPRTRVVRVDYARRTTGKSSYNLWRSAKLAYHVLRSTYDRPHFAATPAPVAEVTP